VRTSPPAGSVVAHAPAAIVLHFDQQVREVATTVTDARGRSALGGAPHTEADDVRALVVPLRSGVPDGDYTVRWQIVSTDGHLISGVFAIGVGSGRPPPQASEVQSSTLDVPFLVSRFAYFCGLVLLIGGAVFRVAVWRPAAAQLEGRAGEMAALREGVRSTQLFTIAAVLMLGGGWVALTRQAAEVAGVSFWAAFDHRGPVASAIQATRFGREFGRGIDLTAVFCVCAAAAFALARRSRPAALGLAVPAVVLGAWAVVVPGLSGHAGDPGRGAVTITVDAIHVAAAAVWIGGLAQLVLVVPHATRGLEPGMQARTRAAVVRRFSTVALGSVAVVGLTGGARALWELGAVSQLWTTGYGRALVVKTALLAGLVVLGYLNRRRLDRFAAVRMRAAAELVLLAGVVAVVAVLTDLQPANAPGFAQAAVPPTGGPAAIAIAGNGRLAVWPGRAGTNVLAARVRAHAAALTALVGGRTIRLTRTADGTYTGFARGLHPGHIPVVMDAGTRTWAATLAIGAPAPGPQPVAPVLRTGAVAAEEAGDLAVGLQRVGRRRARVTVLGPSGAGIAAALVTVAGRVAEPCLKATGVCFAAGVPAAGGTLAVVVRRPGRPAVRAAVDLPPASAPPGETLLRASTRRFRALRSVRALNVLASAPGRAVTTLYTIQAPDRLAADIRGGASARIIGNRRWDRPPGSGWLRSSTTPLHLPNPFWADGAVAVRVAGHTATATQLTLVLPGGPTFFRLWIDRRTGQMVRLRMITAAHFMSEREFDQNAAPPVRPPTGAG
jgi:copper transport protein